MINQPLISILMNCFNGEKFLIDSLNSVIEQSYKNWELIFWDNKSTDNSINIANSFEDKRIRVFKSFEHTNLGKARKNAFKNVRGDYLTFLDVDDIWNPEKLTKQIKVFNDDSVGISFTNSVYFSKKRKENLYKSKINRYNQNTKSLIINYSLSLVSIMIDLNKLKKLSYDFDETYNHISDFDLIVRLSSISKVRYLDQLLSGWRIHKNNESFKRKELFNIEIEKWCNIHTNNKDLKKYKKEIIELKQLTLARKRILHNKINLIELKNIDIQSCSNFKNKIFLIISFIPLLPNMLYQIKEYVFRLKWY